MKSQEQHDRLEQIRRRIAEFPTGPGLYFMKGSADLVLYIGKAKNLRSRAASYFQPSVDLMSTRGPKILEMVEKVQTVDYIETNSEIDAVLQEARLIKDIRPPYNTDLLDSKTFPYLEITTRRQFPGVYITRNPESHRSRLFGPFTTVGDLRATLVVLQKIFRFRTCNLDIRESDDKRRFFRPCLLYSIKQCAAPCADRISRKDYRKLINDMVKFLQSKRSAILRQLHRQMHAASEAKEYETAAMYRDRIRLIERLDHRGSIEENVQPEVFAADPAEALERLQRIFTSDQPIRIIEGFDIAHISGNETVGSMVQFIDGRPFRNGYRRFRIRTVTGIDDCACISEIVTRRYKRAVAGEELWPDVILIDGGRGQLNAALGAIAKMSEHIPQLVSISKKEELLHIPQDRNPVRLASANPARKLLQYVRDEAHRFAQHYHHILRGKKMLGQ